MKARLRWWILGVMGTLSIASIEGAEPAEAHSVPKAPDDGWIIIKGSDTLGAKLVPQWAEAYKAAGNQVEFQIAAEGSSTCFTNLLAGTAELGMSSRKVKSEEAEKFSNAGLELKEVVVGLDVIAVIVNEQNPIKGLTRKQVEGIFTGDFKSWAELGYDCRRLSVYTRNTSSGTYKTFQELAMNKRPYGPDTQKMVEQIALEVGKNRCGIGYVGLAYTGAEGVKVLEIDGVPASAERAWDYPLARQLYFYYREDLLSEEAAAFLDWVRTSDKAADITENVGFVSPRRGSEAS